MSGFINKKHYFIHTKTKTTWQYVTDYYKCQKCGSEWFVNRSTRDCNYCRTYVSYPDDKGIVRPTECENKIRSCSEVIMRRSLG
jgi:hypothetical protein